MFPVPGVAQQNRLGQCGKIHPLETYLGPYVPGHDRDWQARKTLAGVEDNDDCGCLRTAADFGCVLHEPKA
jgi:hypothetical protein